MAEKTKAKATKKTAKKEAPKTTTKANAKAVAKPAAKPAKGKVRDNVIFVGKKPTMSYVLAVITQFTNGEKVVHIKSRGRSISRAVDVSEIVKNRFLGDVKVKEITIGTEERSVEDGNKINVSTMDIVLTK
jgi:DNA-binding protein